MKRNLLNVTQMMTMVLATAAFFACSDDKAVSTPSLLSGKDIRSYATITADKETKKTSIEVKEAGSWKLFTSEDLENPILQGNSPSTVETGINQFKVYCLQWTDGSTTPLAARQQPIEGQPNFRDLGGYKTTDGRMVKWGMVFRSGKTDLLTASDLDYLATIPLKTVIDFRSNEERDEAPDKVPTTVNSEIHLPINTGNTGAEDYMQIIFSGNIAAAKQMLVTANEMMPELAKADYKKFFELLQSGTYAPLMFHCTAGKDRAGLGAALFLSALGVPRETILEDYLLTNTCTGVTVESMKATYGDNDVAVCLYYINSVQLEYITQAFTTIEKNYGSVETYLTRELGVDLNKMRNLYLY